MHIRLRGRSHLAGQIYQQIRDAVLEGRLRPGQPLPPSRELARRLEVSRNTVTTAYDRLAAEGFVTARVGGGTYVTCSPMPEEMASSGATEPSNAPLQARPIWANIPLPSDLSDTPEFDFRAGQPDARLFPYATWRRLLSQQLRVSTVGTGMPHEPAGHLGLRTALARHVRVSRDVRATAADVLVTTGVQQAIDLIGRVLLEAGDCVAIEEPGYLLPWLLWQSLGADVVGVPVDEEGLIVDALPDHARVVYVTTSHQFPTGVAMSLQRRAALLNWAQRHDAAVVEDDYDTEFRYTGRPLEPLQSLDSNGRVLYVGSFSKTLLPILRLGFVVVPPSLRHALRAAKFLTDWHTILPVQAALAEFIDTGDLARHIRRMRSIYKARHDRIAAALAGPLSPWLEPIPSEAGLHISAYLNQGTADDLERLQECAHTAGVEFFHFGQVAITGRTRPGLLLGYGGIPTDRVDEGLRRLHHCLLEQAHLKG